MSVALSDLGDEVEEHVEAGLPRIFPHNVGGRQVEERGAQLDGLVVRVTVDVVEGDE